MLLFSESQTRLLIFLKFPTQPSITWLARAPGIFGSLLSRKLELAHQPSMKITMYFRGGAEEMTIYVAIQKSMEEVKCYAIVNIMTLILEDMDSSVPLDNQQL